MDFATIGARVRERRLKFGMSAQELAERAGVARYTVIRLESGKPCNPSTLGKIRVALAIYTDQLTRPFEKGPFAVHRAADTKWTTSIKKEEYQRRMVDDDPIHVDDPAERRRLGALGFQPFFTAVLGSEIAGGIGGQALMELHQPSWVDRHYGEEFAYCLRGAVTIVVEDVPCTLQEGDSIGFDAMRPHQYLPASPTGPNDPIPLILVVVSRRHGEKTPRPLPPKPRPLA